MSATAMDPVATAIIWARLVAIADEATTTQLRASFSTIVREGNDFAVSVMDNRGGTLASAHVGLPSFAATQAITLRHALESFPLEALEAGDVLITNDPWHASGQLMDLTLLKPIVADGRVVAFGGSVAHAPVGGVLRWSQAADVYEDGMVVPLMKLVRRGERNPDLFRFLAANWRQPSQSLGDLEAQLSALEILDLRVRELMQEYGLDTLDGLVDDIYGRSEQLIREAIERLPDGTYTGQVQIDNSVAGPVSGRIDRPDEAIVIRAAVTVEGSELTVDYEGSSPQLENSTNGIWTFTYAYTVYAIRMLFVPFLPNNAGFMRPVHVRLPEGTVVAARFPAPTNLRHISGQQVCDAIFTALSQAAPELVMAPGGSTPNWTLFMAGDDRRGQSYWRTMTFSGGLGALPRKDGEVAMFPANLSNTPLESVESEAPLLFEAKALIPDSGGPGRQRGAVGQRVVLRAQRRTLFSMLAAKMENAPRGLLGGLDGRRGRLFVNGEPARPGDGVLEAGDVLTIETPGGGGLGPPWERPAAQVAGDVESGLVSPGSARRDYGVVLDATGLGIDPAATAAARAELAAGAGPRG
jgi:N-methylhydantoinase B